MISNRKVGQAQVLYLKEFFDHYFEKKTMTETLSTLSNGLTVLQVLIFNFQSQKGIKSLSVSPVKCQSHSKNETMNAIDCRGQQINDSFEDIYQRLQNIFQNWSGSEERQSITAFKEIADVPHGADEQLYDMLNDYKQDNKKQKQLRKKAEGQCSALRKQLERMEDEQSRMVQLNKETGVRMQRYQMQLREKERQFQQVMQQLHLQENYRQEMQKKMADLTQIIAGLSEAQINNKRLIQDLKESKGREVKLQKKFESLGEMVKLRIAQKQQYWHQMLQAKLNSQTIFEKGACNSVRQFMKTVQGLTYPKLTKC